MRLIHHTLSSTKNYFDTLAIPSVAIVWLLLAFTFLSSCEVINPAEEIPSYLYVEPFSLKINAAREGSNSSKITEAWISMDGQFIGAYSLPAEIPILATGQHQLRLEPGIRDNGINSTPEIYPFYEAVEVTVDLEMNQTDTIRPVTQYVQQASFVFTEPFEVSDHLFRDVIVGNPVDNGVNRTNENNFEGNFSGLVRLDLQQPEVLIGTSRRFQFTDTNNFPTVYLEMDYRSEGIVGFGVIGYGSNNPGTGDLLLSAGFRPREEWNKIYFNLSRIFADNNFFEYQVVFQAAIPQENGTYIQENARIWLDNIKLIRF